MMICRTGMQRRERALHMKRLKIFGVFFSILIAGCASVEPDQKPSGATGIEGVVLETAVTQPRTPSRAQEAAAGMLGAALMARLESSMDWNFTTVKVSDQLSIAVPTRRSLMPGACVTLFVDPEYQRFVTEAPPGVLTMPLRSTLIEPRACR